MSKRQNNGNTPGSGLKLRQTLGLAAVGVVALHLGYAAPSLSFLMLAFLLGMACLSLAETALWESPWGKLAIPTCYDISYTRVLDRAIELGAQGVLNPTMDVSEWGAYQHELHARVPQLRAAEHGIPVFRVASSGISQLVNAQGSARASAPFPGDEAIIGGKLVLGRPGRMPPDRWLAPACTFAAAALIIAALIPRRKPARENQLPNQHP